MKAIQIFMLFMVLAMVQLFVPGKMIFDKEQTSLKGALYKFKTRPVDPYNPFMGRYITLNFDADDFYTSDATSYEYDEKVYVKVTNDSLGYAKIEAIDKEPFKNSDDYFKAEIRSVNRSKGKVLLRFPFNSYFMEETKAYDAEIAYNESQLETLSVVENYEPENDTLPSFTYVAVMIYKGDAVLKDVLINEISIKDYVEE